MDKLSYIFFNPSGPSPPTADDEFIPARCPLVELVRHLADTSLRFVQKMDTICGPLMVFDG
jgi:hypothetical protein